MSKKPVINLFLACMLGFAIFTGYRHVTVVDPNTLPIQTGDVIFQNKLSLESYAMHEATNSPYSHVGIVYYKDFRYYIIDAGRWGVRLNRFDNWVSSGMKNQFVVMRHKDMDETKVAALIQQANTLIGAAYDYGMSFKNDSYYGSELIYTLYKGIDLPIGKTQKISSLNLDHRFTQLLLKTVWRQLPYCQEKQMTFDMCMVLFKEQEIITPESLASDEKMVQIYSNFKPSEKNP